MGPKLNPDGAKIRALRMQRGWTQEQLAEIAGVSPRTIQRAEAAGSAGFETLKAVAGAFEADFDSLLECDAAVSAQPALSARRPRPLLPVAAALAAGLLTGGIVVYRVHTPLGLHFPAQVPGPAVAARAWPNPETRPPAPRPAQTPVILQAAVLPAAPKSESAPAPGLESPTTIPSPAEPAPLGLPRPWQALSAPVILPAPSTDPGGPGAVRQAVSQAAKKTSGFLSRIRASTKRAF